MVVELSVLGGKDAAATAYRYSQTVLRYIRALRAASRDSSNASFGRVGMSDATSFNQRCSRISNSPGLSSSVPAQNIVDRRISV
jgi:hypothetical protein